MALALGLQRTDNEEVSRYVEKKNYLVQVTQHEARNLISSRESGVVNCYGHITVANGVPQCTTTINGTVEAFWAQQFTFKDIVQSDIEREQFEITLTIYDQKDFWKNSVIGSSSIGLGFLYNQSNHEIFYKWITLKDPEDTKNTAKGFVLLSCYIIGEGDDPPMHDANEAPDDEDFDEFAGLDDIDLTPEQLIKKKQRASNCSILDEPKIYDINYQLYVNVVHADALVDDIEAFVSCRVQNYVLTTKVNKGIRPKFNQRCCFPIVLPLQNDKIIVKFWHKKMFKDQFYANIPENPLYENKFHINYLQSTGGNMPFTWINLYGIPEWERDANYYKKEKTVQKPNVFKNYLRKIVGKETGQIEQKNRYIEGTDYLGRVLLSMVLLNHEKPIQKLTSIDGFNDPDSCQYGVVFCCFKVNVIKYDQVFIMFNFGGKYQFTINPRIQFQKQVDRKEAEQDDNEDDKPGKRNILNMKLKEDKADKVINLYWPEDKRRYEFTEDVESTKDLSLAPDLIISLCTGPAPRNKDKPEDTKRQSINRIGYARVSASSDFLAKEIPQWIKFKSVFNNYEGESPGSLLFACKLVHITPNQNKKSKTMQNLSTQNETMQTLVVHIWGCVGLFPWVESSIIDPVISIDFQNEATKTVQFKRGKNASNENNTRNPIFDEMIAIQCSACDSLQFVQPINIIVANRNGSRYKAPQEIGRVNISAGRIGYEKARKNPSEALFKPEMHTLTYKNKIVGKIILSYDFIKGKVGNEFNKNQHRTINKESKISNYYGKTKRHSYYGQKYSLFGLRNVPTNQFRTRWNKNDPEKVIVKINSAIFKNAVWVYPDGDDTYFEESVNICKTNTDDWNELTINEFLKKLHEPERGEPSSEKANSKNVLDKVQIIPFQLFDEFHICWPIIELEFYSVKESNVPKISDNGCIDKLNLGDLKLIFFTEIPMIETMKDIKKADLQSYRAMMGLQGKVAARMSMADKEDLKAKISRTSSVRRSTSEARSGSLIRSSIVKAKKYTSKSNMRSSKLDEAQNEPIDQNVDIKLDGTNQKMIANRLSKTLASIKEEPDENVFF